MFSPSSHEDPFTNGTGLGLSIVRQRLDPLRERLDVEKTHGTGTVVGVHMSLLVAC